MTNGTTVSTAESLVPNDGSHDRGQALMIVELFFLCTISLVGITGNVIICKNMIRRKGKSSEYFIINLALTDLSVCAIGIPLQIYENTQSTWKFGTFLCKIIWPYQTLLVLVSILSLTAMSLERHRAIMTPLKTRVKKSFLLKSIAGVWIIGICVVAPYVNFLSFDGKVCAENWPMEMSGAYYTLSLFVIDYCIPLTIITFCYARASYKLYTNTREFKTISEPSSISNLVQRKRLRTNKRIIKRFSFAVLVFLLCMLPGDCFWMWKSFGDNSTFVYESHFRRFTDILLYANSAINPFIFGACHTGCWSFLCGKQGHMHSNGKRRIMRFHSEESSLNLRGNGKKSLESDSIDLKLYRKRKIRESSV